MLASLRISGRTTVRILVVLVSISLQGGWRASAAEQSARAQAVVFPPDKPDMLLYDAGATAPNGVRLLTSGDETSGVWSLVELTEMPGTKTTWHRHAFDQAYYVREGTVTFKVEDNVHVLSPGGYVFIPRGTPHGHANFGNTAAKVLLTNAPAGFERYFHARAELLKTMKPDHPGFRQRMSDLRQKYQTEELGVWDNTAK